MSIMNKTISILVVDDHPIVRGGIKTMLEMGKFESYSFQVKEAGNILDAIKLVDQQTFSLIITDSQLGKHSGAELTKSLLRLAPEQAVLGFSESDDMNVVEHMLKAGAKGFIKNIEDTGRQIEGIKAFLGWL